MSDTGKTATVELDDVNNVDVAAAYLKRTEDALMRLARQGRIGSTIAGRKRTFTRESILKFVADNERAATQAANVWGLTDASARAHAAPRQSRRAG